MADKIRWAAWQLTEDEKLHATEELALDDAIKKSLADQGTAFYVLELTIHPVTKIVSNVVTTDTDLNPG